MRTRFTRTLCWIALAAASGLGGAWIARSPLAGAAEGAGGDGVIHLDVEKVAAAFRKGTMLIETPRYKVMAGHRVEAGVPELHAADTDVFYIVDGSATFVTGGKVIDPKEQSPGEVRGSRIEGGEARSLKKGEVLVIPHGVPHWFRDVPRLVDYFVVKVTAPEAAKGAAR